MKYGKTFLSLLVLFFICLSCQSDQRLTKTIESNLSSVEFINADSLFSAAKNAEKTLSTHHYLNSTIGPIYAFEVKINTQQTNDSMIGTTLFDFYNDSYIKALEQEKQKINSEVQQHKALTRAAFTRLAHYFPELALPEKIVFINKLFSGIKSADSVITVGLESYVDNSSQIIQEIPTNQLFQWQKEDMNIKYLSRDILLNWIQGHLFEDLDEPLAQHIIQAGKLLLTLEACFPEHPEEFVLRYSKEEYSWATSHEKLFWEYLVREELLFKNNMRDKTNFLNEGPYTIGLPENGPDRLGQYLGWKIVKQYFLANKELSLQDLLATDYNTILQAFEIN